MYKPTVYHGYVMFIVCISVIVLLSIILAGTSFNDWDVNTISYYMYKFPSLTIVFETFVFLWLLFNISIDVYVPKSTAACIRMFFNYAQLYSLVVLGSVTIGSYDSAHMGYSYMAVVCSWLLALVRLFENGPHASGFLFVIYMFEVCFVLAELGIIIAFSALGLVTSARQTGILEYTFYFMVVIEFGFRVLTPSFVVSIT